MECSWGVDVSDGALSAVRLTRQHGRYQVLAAHRFVTSGPGEWIAPLRTWLGDIQRESILRFLREARPSPGDTLCVGYPGLAVVQRVLSLPPVSSDRLAGSIEFEIKQVARFGTEDLSTRHRLLDRGTTKVAESRALAIATPREHLLTFGEDLRKLGLRADLVEPETVALASFLDWERPASLPLLAVQIGFLRSEVVALSHHQVFSRALPYGAGAVLHDPASTNLFALARRIAKDLRATARVGLGELDQLGCEKILILGPAAGRAPLIEALTAELGLAVAPLGALHRLHLHDRVTLSGLDSAEIVQLGTALGLALSGLGVGGLSLPLVPLSFSRRVQRLIPITSGAAFAASALLLWLTIEATQKESRIAALVPRISRERELEMAQQSQDLESKLRANAAQGRLIHAVAAAPSTMLVQLQQLIESLAQQPLPCRLTHVAVRHRPGSTQVAAEARLEVAAADLSAVELRLTEMASALALAGFAVSRPSSGGLELTWQAEVGA